MSTLIIEVMKAVIPFLMYFFLWVLFFALLAIILGANRNLAAGYTGMPMGIAYFVNTFENGVGNINAPTIGYTSQKDFEETGLDKTIISLIYGFWFFAQIFLLVVLLNFVIALIS